MGFSSISYCTVRSHIFMHYWVLLQHFDCVFKLIPPFTSSRSKKSLHRAHPFNHPVPLFLQTAFFAPKIFSFNFRSDRSDVTPDRRCTYAIHEGMGHLSRRLTVASISYVGDQSHQSHRTSTDTCRPGTPVPQGWHSRSTHNDMYDIYGNKKIFA